MKQITFLILIYVYIGQSFILYGQIKFNPELQLRIERAHSRQSDASVNSTPQEIGVIIYTEKPEKLKASGIKVNSIMPNFITANLTLQQIEELAAEDEIKFINSGEINDFHNDFVSLFTGTDLLRSGAVNNDIFTGKDVIVCIIDTGIDWKHPDFRDPVDQNKSRIIAIWDQTLTPINGENPPELFTYGVEYSKSDIENELDGSPAAFIRETDVNGHGTHIAGTAAGNGTSGKYKGMAPEADILVIKAGNGSFQTSNIIDALSWTANKAALLGKPVVVNMSFGSDAGPHDGTDAKSKAVNNFTGEGKVVVVSAGNSGGSKKHFSGEIPSGGSSTLSIVIPEYTPNAGSGNDNVYLDTWIDNNPDVSMSVKTPNEFLANQTPGKQGTTSTGDGAVYLYNYVIDQNKDTELFVGLYDSDAAKTPSAGIWEVTFTNNSDSIVEFHSWLYDACIGNSFAYLTNGDDNYTLGNTASEAIIVGSYADRWTWTSGNGSIYSCGSQEQTFNISSFSSKGPARNKINKPDITAPGQAVISCSSGDAVYSQNKVISEFYVMNQGTSMSSAVMSGAAALLLEQDKNLSAKRLMNLITSSASKDELTGQALPDNTWGFGKLNIHGAIKKLQQSSVVSVIPNKIYGFQLDQNYPNPFNPVTTISYHLPKDCNIYLRVYDILGKDIMLVESGFRKAGSYNIGFNGKDLASGIYFYELKAGEFRSVKKFVLQK